MTKSVFLVAGTRPNFMKVAPIYRAVSRRPAFRVSLVHTGQHYDDALSNVFFRDLELPPPAISLEVGSGAHGAQTAKILERFERALVEHEPDLVIVVGDVNSTVACAIATKKIVYRNGGRPLLAHVEAGLRSHDRTMPEEINRLLTDSIADLLFTTEESANDHLRREGIPDDRVFFVGNVMIDTVLQQAERAAAMKVWRRYGLEPRQYAVLTLHRPSNVDSRERLESLVDTLHSVGNRLPIVFPAHPRTLDRCRTFGLDDVHRTNGLRLTAPLPYLEFLSLMTAARIVLTDSGGIQEETTILGVPCLTLRENTERPVTVTHGTNRIVGTTHRAITREVDRILSSPIRSSPPPELWDGRAAERIADVLEGQLWNSTLPPASPSERSPRRTRPRESAQASTRL